MVDVAATRIEFGDQFSGRQVDVHSVCVKDRHTPRLTLNHIMVTRARLPPHRLIEKLQRLPRRQARGDQLNDDVDVEPLKPKLGPDGCPDGHRALLVEEADLPFQWASVTFQMLLDGRFTLCQKRMHARRKFDLDGHSGQHLLRNTVPRSGWCSQVSFHARPRRSVLPQLTGVPRRDSSVSLAGQYLGSKCLSSA